MKVKIKTQDNYFDMVKLKCSAVEFLTLKQALNDFKDNRAKSYEDRIKAMKMLENIEKGVDNAKRRVLDSK